MIDKEVLFSSGVSAQKSSTEISQTLKLAKSAAYGSDTRRTWMCLAVAVERELASHDMLGHHQATSNKKTKLKDDSLLDRHSVQCSVI